MDTSTISQLPDFQVERMNIHDERGSHDMFRVVCPHCKHEFWVMPGVWPVLHPVMGRSDAEPAYPFGRNCPYGGCWKTSAIPEGLRIRFDSPITTPKPRVVRRRKSR